MGFWIAMVLLAAFVAYDLWHRRQQPRWDAERIQRWEDFRNRKESAK